jgi:hypothetical protein
VLTDGCRVVVQLWHRRRGSNTKRHWVAGAMVWASIAIAGCTTSVESPVVAKSIPPPRPPVSVAALDGLLLKVDEIQRLTAGGVTGSDLINSMRDESGNVAEKPCAALDNSVETRVYAGSGWISVRRQYFTRSFCSTSGRFLSSRPRCHGLFHLLTAALGGMC